MGEAGTHCPIPRARNTSKFQNTFLSGCSELVHATENNKIINKIMNAYHFLTDFVYLERINFYKACNRHIITAKEVYG